MILGEADADPEARRASRAAVSSSASVMNSLKISRPEAPIAILTPTSRTRSFSVAIWMLTLTMPPPISDRMPESRKMMS